MRTGLAVAFLLLLVGCTVQSDRFRDTSVPMGASARFDAAAFSGNWLVFMGFDADAAQGTQSIEIEPDGDGLRIKATHLPAISGTYRMDQTGVLTPLDPDQEPLVVMWVDEDFETAAIGTVSGRFGAVLDRDGRVPPDRERAVRDIMAFYGWRVDEMKRTGK